MSIFICGRSLAAAGAGIEDLEWVREVEGEVDGDLPSGPGQGRRLLQSTRIACRARGELCSAESCLGCDRFINYVPSPDRRRVTVRCYWSGRDSVRDLMTPASKLVAVPVDATVGDARMLASEYDRDFLLVVDGAVLVGVVRRRDIEWAETDQLVSRLTRRRIWMISVAATLADLARVVAERGADCVLVVEDAALRGMVTRDDLRELGWTRPFGG